MWFEIAVAALFLLFGHIVLGHFEERTPRWKILLKHSLGMIIFVSIGYWLGRFWFFTAISATIIPVFIIHVWWLPKNGINGWTGEPKEKYYELRGWKIDEKK